MYTFGTYRKMRLQKKLSNRSPRVEITVVTVEQQLNPKLKNQRSTKFFGNYSQLRWLIFLLKWIIIYLSITINHNLSWYFAFIFHKKNVTIFNLIYIWITKSWIESRGVFWKISLLINAGFYEKCALGTILDDF